MNIWPILFALLTLAGAPPGDDASPDRYPRRDGIDIQRYRFELTLSDETDEIVGRATVHLRFTAVGVRTLALDLVSVGGDGRGMTVGAVTAGTDTLRAVHEDDLLTITLPRAMLPTDSLAVTVEYRGVPADGLRIGPNRYDERTFFSDNWPNRVRHWLPTIDHVYDKAGVEFLVTAPAHYQVVSNGLLVEETDGPDGTRLTHWRETAPIAPWLFTVGVARFAVERVGDFDGKPIQTWVYARDRDAGFYDFAEPTEDALRFFQTEVGPYAYGKLANVQSAATPGGMEAATAIMYAEASVTGERTERWRNVIIHEVAHQWFGNAVTESDWNDVWLSEGFATYYTLLFIENRYGREAFVAGLRSAAERVWQWYEDNPDYRIVHADLDDMGRVTSVATYQKGAWVLHMLRKRMGDVAFRVGMRRYYTTYMNGHATTEDFRRVMERVSGQDLGDFFDQWLHSGGNPRLSGTWRYDAAAGAVVIELQQLQRVGPTYDLPLEIGLEFDDRRTPRIETVELTDRRQSFTLPVRRAPTDVVLDPNVWTLFRADFRRAGS